MNENESGVNSVVKIFDIHIYYKLFDTAFDISNSKTDILRFSGSKIKFYSTCFIFLETRKFRVN